MDNIPIPNFLNVLHWLSGVILFFLSISCFIKARNKRSYSFSFFIFLLANWSICAALIFNLDDIHLKIFFSRMRGIVVTMIPLAIFFLAHTFTDRPKLPKWLIAILWFIPLISIGTLLSPYYEYYIHSFAMKNIFQAPLLVFQDGPIFFIHNIQTRLIVVWSLYLLARANLTFQKPHQSYGWILFFSIFIPFILDSIGVMFVPDIRFLQMVPVTLFASGICFFLVIFKSSVLEILPIARNLIVDSIPEIYLIVDHLKQVVDFNKFSAKSLNISHDLCGKPIQILHKISSNPLASHIIEAIENDEIKKEIELQKNSETEYFLISLEPIYNKSNSLLGRLIIVKDITNQKRYEKQLGQIAEIRTKFIGLLAHDIIGNLSSQQLFLESMIENPDFLQDEYFKENLELVLHSSQNVTTYINNLLTWSKENLHTIELKKAEANIGDLIVSTIDMLEGFASQKKINFHIDSNEKIYAVIDTNMILTVIRNLLSNALKMAPETSTIKIKTKKENNQINISIIDEGPGVDEGEINNFLNSLGVKSYNGGLGLTMCREFIRLHNGKIVAKNNGSAGATFTFSLPMI